MASSKKLTQFKYIAPYFKKWGGNLPAIQKVFSSKPQRLRRSSQKNPFLREKGNLPQTRHQAQLFFHATIPPRRRKPKPKKRRALKTKAHGLQLPRWCLTDPFVGAFSTSRRFHRWNGMGRGRLVGTGGKTLVSTGFWVFFLGHNETACENWWFFRKGDLTTLFMVWGGTQPPTCCDPFKLVI